MPNVRYALDDRGFVQSSINQLFVCYMLVRCLFPFAMDGDTARDLAAR